VRTEAEPAGSQGPQGIITKCLFDKYLNLNTDLHFKQGLMARRKAHQIHQCFKFKWKAGSRAESRGGDLYAHME
jgi:hypothetical protein